MKRALHLVIGLAVGGLFAWLALRQVAFEAVVAAMAGASLPELALAPVCLALGYACRVQRWRAMLRLHNPALGFGRAAVPFVASIAVNNLIPFRAGDVLRCFGFTRWLQVAPGAVLASVLVERLLDLVALLIALALALWVFSASGDTLGLGGVGALGLAAAGVVALGLLVNPGPLASLCRAAIRLVGAFGDRARATAAGVLTPLAEGLIGLSSRRMMTGLIGWTLPVWLFEGATYWAVARALPSLTVPDAAWLAMPAGTLATLLPSTPGHIGTFDYFAQAATVAGGNQLAAATAFVIIIHVVLWLTTTLTGAICLMIWALAPQKKVQP